MRDEPGARCGTCGTFACSGQNSVACNDPGANACGGCSALPSQPGARCGTCGTFACSGQNSVACNDPYVDPATTCATNNYECGTVPDGCGNRVSCGACSVLQSCASNRCACQRPDAVYGNATYAPTGGVATSPSGRYTATVIRPNGVPGLQIRDNGTLIATLSYPSSGAITYNIVAVAWAPGSGFFAVEIEVRYTFGMGSTYAYGAYEYNASQIANNQNPSRSVNFDRVIYRQMRYGNANALTVDNDCVAPHVTINLP